jgi:NifU-like protein involved in Fe-S cluster formation
MRERINKLVDEAYRIHEELEKIERELRQHLADKGKLPEGQALCHLAQLGLSTCRDKLRELREMVHTTR